MIDMKPKDTIKLKTVQLNKTYQEQNVLPERWFIQVFPLTCRTPWRPKKKATGFIWSKNTYRLDGIVQEPGNRILC